MFQQLRPMLSKNLWRHLIAGCPVINKGKKLFHFFDACFIVFPFGKKKCVKLILIKRAVRKLFQKRADVIPLYQLFRKLSELRRPYPDEGFRIRCRDQLALKIPIGCILKLEQFLSDFVCQH